MSKNSIGTENVTLPLTPHQADDLIPVSTFQSWALGALESALETDSNGAAPVTATRC